MPSPWLSLILGPPVAHLILFDGPFFMSWATFVKYEGCVPQNFCENGGPLAHFYAAILVVVHLDVVRLGA